MKQIICSKRIAIYCVTYHSYEALYGYLESIEEAAKRAADAVTVDVFVADNTDSKPQTIDYKAENFNLRVFPIHENLGYFGAVRLMMKQASPIVYDYVIISNVDMTFRSDTLIELLQTNISASIGWVAPAIISEKTGFDLNPQSVKRYSKKELKMVLLMYKYPILDKIHTTLFYRKRFHKKLLHHHIYAGHGSCIILTRWYFEQCGLISYPVFLYSEEIYLAEECRNHHLEVIYQPNIVVNDIGKVSTGKASKKLYYHWCYKAISHILNTYYR